MLNNKEIETYNILLEEDLIKALECKVKDRKNFKYDSKAVTIPRYFYRFIGADCSEEEYSNMLYETNKALSKYDKLYLHIPTGFNRDIDMPFLSRLNSVWDRICRVEDFTAGIVADLLNNANLTLELPNAVLNRQIKENIRGLIDYYFECNNNEVEPVEFKNILFYMSYWINLYLPDLFADFDYGDVNPKVFYYGDITPEEIFFLIYLSSLGCDIIYFNPSSDCAFERIDRGNIFSLKKEGIRRLAVKPFPSAQVVTRAGTAAFKASEELKEKLHTEDSFCYKPWQFSDYDVCPVTLKTTYSEIYIWGKEQAMVRPNWEVKDKTVYIPNLFAKVSGVHPDINLYWREMGQLREQKNVMMVKRLPIIYAGKMYSNASYYSFMDSQNKIDRDKLMGSNVWKYSHLRTQTQDMIMSRIIDFCSNPRARARGMSETEVKEKTFGVLTSLDDKFLQMLQQFDYPNLVPKLVVYNNEQNGNLSFQDAVLMMFLNSVGVDIIIYNPAGYNDIENYVDNNYYDIHRLEEVAFNLAYKEKSPFSKLFAF